jgi:hypothetical protein
MWHGFAIFPHPLPVKWPSANCTTAAVPLAAPLTGARQHVAALEDVRSLRLCVLRVLQGIRAVLEEVGAAPAAVPVNGRPAGAVWHVMREEPVVYING